MKKFDFFIAQATIMPKVATVFGRILGSRGKMPNPKAGCVVPPATNLRALVQRLQKLVKISVKANAAIQTVIGNEELPDEEIADNVLTVYDALLHALPAEKHNIKGAFIKLTMGNPVKIGEKETSEQKMGKKGMKKKSKEKSEDREGQKEEQKTEIGKRPRKEVESATGN